MPFPSSRGRLGRHFVSFLVHARLCERQDGGRKLGPDLSPLSPVPMAAAALLYERVHYRHAPHWLLRAAGQSGSALCLACLIEMMQEAGLSVVRKKHALSCFHHVLRDCTAAVTELLTQDHRVCAHFLGTLLGMLQSVEDGTALDLISKVLMQLVVELKSEQFVHCILDECHKELSKVSSMRGSLPLFTFLGKLVDAIPALADTFIVEHGNLLEHLAMGLVYPNEGVKAAICYLYGKLYSSPTAAEKLSPHFTEKLCGLFLATMENAQTWELQINCLGFLKQLLNLEHLVSMIMSMPVQETDSENTELLHAENPLPLVLKKMLLSRDETLKVASAQCMAAVLVHSPGKYAPAFIHADIPEFLFEQLSCTSEVLIWSLYCCLLLLTEERLFFSKCHTVYGIESVVRSLREVLRMNNVELHKQGLLLLTDILKRQPVEIKLFTSIAIFKDTVGVLLEAVNSPVLDVAAEAMNAAAAFLRKEHLSVPVQYEELQDLVEAVLKRCVDLSLPPLKRRPMGHPVSRDQSKKKSRPGHLLHRALQSFQNACRLALDCRMDPSAQENAFTTPSSEKGNTLEKFDVFLLKICDSICIPVVMKHYVRAPSPAVMEVFFSVLDSLFTVVPGMKEKFAIKLASTSFIRLTLEVKATFCSRQSNPTLNQACSGFLCCLCCALFSAAEWKYDSQPALSEVSVLLQQTLPRLNGNIPECLALLSESPALGTDESLRDQQHSILLIFCLAYTLEDRFISEGDLFWAVQGFLRSVQDHGDSPPSFVLRAVLYLLAVCQDTCQALDEAILKILKRVLESTPDLQSLYCHHLLFLKLFLRYPQLTERFGHRILELWMSSEDYSQTDEGGTSLQPPDPPDVSPVPPSSLHLLLNILTGNSRAILILLDLVYGGSVDVAHKVLVVLKSFLTKNEDFLITDVLRSRFLQILQRVLIENSSAELQANRNLPLSLCVLWMVQLKDKAGKELGSTDFKLLYHVGNLCGRCRSSSVEILQPSLNYLYCSLHQASSCSRKRAVALLLSNVPFMELLQKVLELTWAESPVSLSSSDGLLCSAWLLVSSLSCFQHSYNSEVHSTVLVEVDEILNIIAHRKKRKSTLLLASLVLFLRAALKQSFTSSLVITTPPEARNRPLTEPDACLYPLRMQKVRTLLIGLQNLLIQNDPLLQQAAVGCLEALLDYLHPRSQDAALHVASQPWNRCALTTALHSGEKAFLQPGILRLMALFLRYESRNILSPGEIAPFLQQTASLPVSELPTATCRALQLLLTQLQNTKGEMEPAEGATIQNLLERIQGRTKAQEEGVGLVCVGGVAISLSHIGD